MTVCKCKAWDIRFLCSDSLAEGCNTFPLFVCASGSYSIETWCCLKTGCCRAALRITVAPQSSFGECWEGIIEHFGILKAKERLQYREAWFHWKSWVWCCVIKVHSVLCSFYDFTFKWYILIKKKLPVFSIWIDFNTTYIIHPVFNRAIIYKNYFLFTWLYFV